MTMLWASVSVMAYGFKVDGIYYNITSETDQTVEVTSCDNPCSADVEIRQSLIFNTKTYTVTSIGKSAFCYCRGMTSVTIPSSVTSIGESVFSGCSGLTSVTIPNSVTSIGKFAFSECYGLASVTIGNSVESIGNEAFYRCSGLASMTIPNSVTEIGTSAFGDCEGLTSVTIPNSVTSLGYAAFSGCSNLASVTIGNSVTEIGAYAFDSCSALTSVTIPSSVTYIGSQPFICCEQLENIYVELDNVAYSSQDGILYNKDVTLLICCPATKEEVTIPNSVKEIGEFAFFCSGSKSLTIGNSVKSIGRYAFGCCWNLTEVIIPDSVKFINEYAFYACKELKSLTIGKSVRAIDSHAIDCQQLETIYCRIIKPFSCAPGFYDINYRKTVLYVPKGSLSAYEEVEPWCNFWYIEEKDYDAEDETTSVDSVIADLDAKTEVGRFNLQGIEVGNDYKGLVIIRYSDGSSCKTYSK